MGYRSGRAVLQKLHGINRLHYSLTDVEEG